jgi:bifunctional UDP-N-acetylglucosamine pyrophosphorylase/glucosamine-1-phosphate N-acetyltransferase
MNGPVAIILAAGHGKRMKSQRAKVLHEVCGQPMLRYVVDAARGGGAKTIIVVVGHGADQVQDYLKGEPDVLFAVQDQQLGTGHAARVCRPLLEGYHGPAMILVGDVPLLRAKPLANLLERQRAEKSACLLATTILPDPTGFGRILRDSAGRFLRIVEERDCTPEERAIHEVNPSCYIFELPVLWDALDRLETGNAQGEYYLTDAPAHLMAMYRKVQALNVLEADDVLGVNTRQHLAQASAIMQARIQEYWMAEGVTIIDPKTTQIDGRATIGPDTVIHPFSVITGRVKIGANCTIGPFAHVRDGSALDDRVQVGAFVEVNRTHLGENTLARHLAYLGDAEVGRDVNIGATAVTANFDGTNKNRTWIGDGTKIGAGAVLVAPVKVGSMATVGANAVVTRNRDVADGETVAGVPARPLGGEGSK